MSIAYEYEEPGNPDNWLEFSRGSIEIGVYSYQIDSTGRMELDEHVTRDLYLAMKQYYERSD